MFSRLPLSASDTSACETPRSRAIRCWEMFLLFIRHAK